MEVATGLERIANGEFSKLFRKKKIGLLAHPASVTSKFMHASDVLREAGAIITALFGPEHGFSGQAQDMIGVAAASTPVAHSSVPTYSLYGDSEESLAPRSEWLDGLDALVIDLQDVGARYYTFVWTAILAIRVAQARGMETIVLDRPNPLGGEIVEGAPQRAGYRSFVGLCDVAVRHGMTMGEIVAMQMRREKWDEKSVHVIPMLGWARRMSWEETRLPWVLPSPNMPTADTARVYPGGCLIEGTNLSEGRGTTRPFEIFGAPFVPAHHLAREVRIQGAALRALSFEPTFHKHAGRECHGIQLHVVDARIFRPYDAYLRILDEIARHARGEFAWRTEIYEFVSDRPAIDLLTGGPEIRMAIDKGHGLEEELRREAEAAARFKEERSGFLLYS